MAKTMKCSRCGKRAFDISELPKEKVHVELKCPQCNKIVRVSCDAGSEYVVKKTSRSDKL